MKNQAHPLPSSQNYVLPEQTLAFIRENKKTLKDFPVEYFSVISPDTNLPTVFFDTKPEAETALQSLRLTCHSAHCYRYNLYFSYNHELALLLLTRVERTKEV